MKPSRSEFHEIRSIRHHVRVWGDAAAPRLFLLHGWMDVSASFQFLVDACQRDWCVIAPDWRGFGQTGWTKEGYWFQDYYADLDALVDIYSPREPALIVGHSMGGNIALTYAGVQPGRVRKLVSLEGFGMGRAHAGMAPARYERWLKELKEPQSFRPYASFDAVAERLMKNNPRLSRDKAGFLARHWAQEVNSEIQLCFDPRHKIVNPVLSRLEELVECWKRVSCPTLWVISDHADTRGWHKDTPEQFAERTGAFRDFRMARLTGSGHMMHHDQPEKLAAILEEFLAA
jgi:pimeloyl-ACP methyl ester carboxylesterase